MGKCASKQNSQNKSLSETTDNYSNPQLEQFIAKSSLRSYIYVPCQPLTEQDIKIVIREVIIKKQCKELVITCCTLTPQHILILTDALRNNKTLERLTLNRNQQIGDHGAELLANLLTCDDRIHKDDQSNNKVSIRVYRLRLFLDEH